MRRQKKFYAWGYADEDLSPDEIKPWEAEIAQRYGLNGFDVTPPPKPEEITLRAPRVAVPSGAAIDRAHRSPDAARAQLRQGGLRHLAHVHALGAQSARRRRLPGERAGHRARARLVRPDRRQGDPLWRRLVGGEGHRAAGRVRQGRDDLDAPHGQDPGSRRREPGGAHPGRHLRAGDRGRSCARRRSPCATTCRPIAARPWAAGSPRARAATTPRSTPTSTTSSKARAW